MLDPGEKGQWAQEVVRRNYEHPVFIVSFFTVPLSIQNHSQ